MEAGAVNDSFWTAWPACAECGRRRQTECPTCGSAGTEFPMAEYQAPTEPIHGSRDAGAANRSGATGLEQGPVAPRLPSWPLLHCPQCDEAFTPRFYRQCPQCGHDQGEGIRFQSWQPEPISHRVVITILGLLGLALGTALYLWRLFPD
jgi:hypothetical protein